MGLDVAKELARLRQRTVPELRQRYAEVFGEPSHCRHKQFLIKRILWRMQANEQGDLSERARKRAEELANDADLRLTPPKVKGAAARGRTVTMSAPARAGRAPAPGTILTRAYKGRDVRVLVLDKGFEYEGRVYRSLSAVAKAVTGSHWNGWLFFGIARKENGR
jgi:hypothetical protein